MTKFDALEYIKKMADRYAQRLGNGHIQEEVDKAYKILKEELHDSKDT